MHSSLRSVFFSSLLITSGMSGCSWYMDTANSIGSHMPTYDGWFGDGEKKTASPTTPPAYPDAPPAMPVPPRGQAMPQGYYPVERVQVPAPDASQPPVGGPSPDEGLRRMQMTPPPGMPQGYAPPQPPVPSQAPLMPFTEPVLENPVQVEEQSGRVEEKPANMSSLPADLPLADMAPAAGETKERGTFAFVDDVSESIAGWFGDSEKKEEYPDLATVPETPAFKQQQRAVEESRAELVADRDAAQKEQGKITDWSQLVDAQPKALPNALPETANAAPAPMIEPVPSAMMPMPLNTIRPVPAAALPEPKEMPVELTRVPEPEAPLKVAPAKEEESSFLTLFSRDKKAETPVEPSPEMMAVPQVPMAPAAPQPIVAMPAAEPVAETRPEYLRAPEVAVMPASRYSARRAEYQPVSRR